MENTNLTPEQTNLKDLHDKAFQAIQELVSEAKKTQLTYPVFLTFFEMYDGSVRKKELKYHQITFKQ